MTRQQIIEESNHLATQFAGADIDVRIAIKIGFQYAANWRIVRGTLGQSKGWNNKMFVRAEACKHQIRITDVRVEKLQEISEDCCLKEGIIKKWHAPACKNYYYVPGVEVKSVEDVHNTPQEAFAHLINKVSRKEMWEANPYVFVYDFELVK